MKNTPGPWIAKDVPGAGWQITARLRSWEGRLLKFYRTLPQPTLRVQFSGDGLELHATLGFEEWCQFPADGWAEELADNMRLIAASPERQDFLKRLTATSFVTMTVSDAIEAIEKFAYEANELLEKVEAAQ